jgi:hypothetical protein
MSPLPDNHSTKKSIPSVFDHECERPACADIQQMFQQQQQQQMLNPSNVKTTSNNLKNTDTTTTTSPVVTDEPKNDRSECPVDSSTLGRASWTLLHSMVRQRRRYFDTLCGLLDHFTIREKLTKSFFRSLHLI